jgi:hypothetical protein
VHLDVASSVSNKRLVEGSSLCAYTASSGKDMMPMSRICREDNVSQGLCNVCWGKLTSSEMDMQTMMRLYL